MPLPTLPKCSDEVYALSVFKEHARFTSALLLAQQLVGTPSASSAAAAGMSSSSGPAEGTADGSEAAASSGPAAAAEGEGEAAAASLGSLSLADGGSSGTASSSSYSQRQVDNYVHMVYGLSKDWCASGLRVGMLYSRNTRLQKVGEWLGGWVVPCGRSLVLVSHFAKAASGKSKHSRQDMLCRSACGSKLANACAPVRRSHLLINSRPVRPVPAGAGQHFGIPLSLQLPSMGADPGAQRCSTAYAKM